jgi:hypothetical protein
LDISDLTTLHGAIRMILEDRGILDTPHVAIWAKGYAEGGILAK